MTTITIKDNTALSRTIFENLEDLQEFLSLQFFDNKEEFSDEFKADLNRREEDILSGKEKGIPWEDVKSKLMEKSN